MIASLIRHFEERECLSSIPKGLNQSAQGWPIQRGLPWVETIEFINTERV